MRIIEIDKGHHSSHKRGAKKPPPEHDANLMGRQSATLELQPRKDLITIKPPHSAGIFEEFEFR